MAANAIYQLRSDNVARTATITVGTGGPAPTGYEADNLVDDNPAKVAKIDATTGAWVFDFAAAQRVDLVALIHHDFDAAADVKIQANTSDSWGTPAFSATITIPTWEGASDTRWPVNPWLDLTGQSGYSATGWRYWRLVVTSNSQNLQLGQIWLSPTIRTFTVNYAVGADRTRTRVMQQNRTRVGVDHLYPVHAPRYALRFTLPYMTATLAAALTTQWDNVGGRWSPWLFVPDARVNSARLVRYGMTEEQRKQVELAYETAEITVEEVARGLRAGT